MTTRGNVEAQIIANHKKFIWFFLASFDSESKDEQQGDDSEDEIFYPQPAKLANKEFFDLLLSCLKGHEDQRDSLLTALQRQLVHYVKCVQEVSVTKFVFFLYELILNAYLISQKADINYLAHPEAKSEMIEALDLRLSLVGTLFDGIYRSLALTQDWASLFTQLLCNGVIDYQTNT